MDPGLLVRAGLDAAPWTGVNRLWVWKSGKWYQWHYVNGENEVTRIKHSCLSGPSFKQR